MAGENRSARPHLLIGARRQPDADRQAAGSPRCLRLNGELERWAVGPFARHLPALVRETVCVRLDLQPLDSVELQQLVVDRCTLAPEDERRLALLQRQRATLQSLVQRQTELGRQLENAGLALDNLRFDLIKLRSSGLQSALADVTSATQEARSLSRDLGAVLDAAEEVRSL